MIQAIFFDFNGVIIDDERLHLRAYREVLQGHSVELTDDDYFKCLGMDDVAFTRAAFERVGRAVDDETSREFDLAIVSMAELSEIEHVLAPAKLLQHFTVIVTADPGLNHKPAPDCYRRALDLLNNARRDDRRLPLIPTECLVIEDAPPGVRAGKAAGMRALAVTNTVSEILLREAGAEG